MTNGTIAMAEILHTALCYYRLGDVEKGWRLLQGALHNFAHGRVPGTISQYAGEDARQGTYPDFADSSSMFARVVVEGLFGIKPHRQDNVIVLQPGFPREWSNASIRLRDICYEYERSDDMLHLSVHSDDETRKIVRLVATQERVCSARLNGKPVPWSIEPGIGRSFVVIEVPPSDRASLEVAFEPAQHEVLYDPVAVVGDRFGLQARNCEILSVSDPQGLLGDTARDRQQLSGLVKDKPGVHTLFALLEFDDGQTWMPVDLDIRQPIEIVDARLLVPQDGAGDVACVFGLRNNRATEQVLDLRASYLAETLSQRVHLPARASAEMRIVLSDVGSLTPGVTPITVDVGGDWQGTLTAETRLWRICEALPGTAQTLQRRCKPVLLTCNDRLEDVFTHTYDSPRPPAWALQIDEHALNAWTGTWYDPATINTDHLVANLDKDGVFFSDIGVPFFVPADGPNGLFVAKWDRYPDEVEIPIDDTASELYLLLAGSTLNNQTYISNGLITIEYTDGSHQISELINPDNYDHVLQHFSQNYPQWIGGERDGFYGVGHASGAHADILNIPVEEKPIRAIKLTCVSYEIIIGLLALTLVHPVGTEAIEEGHGREQHR